MSSNGALRNRAWHYLGQDTALACGMSLPQLQQFIAGSYHPTTEQLQKLATRMKMTEDAQ
jgi:hypothetical protein